MTDTQKSQIVKLREMGMGYTAIAKTLGISENTVKSFCRRNKLNGVAAASKKSKPLFDGLHFCHFCGKEVAQNPGRKKKKFCSDKCRNKWWNSNLDKVNRKAIYSFECLNCKNPFTAYGNSKRKYCCLECYANRNKGGRA